METGRSGEETHDQKYDRLIKRQYDRVKMDLSRIPALKMELRDGRHVVAMPTKEIATGIMDAQTTEGGMSVGLWADLQWLGLSTSDRGVDNREITPIGHETLVARRSEVMGRICQNLDLESLYSELKPEEKQIFLESNYVRLLSELAQGFSERVYKLEQELEMCRKGA